MFHDTVTVVRATTGTDQYGNDTRDWATATRTTVAQVAVLPTTQVEDAAGNRIALSTGWRVFTAPGTDVDLQATDRVEWNGITLEVIGEVARWPHPIRPGAVHHVEADLRRVTG